MNHLRRLNFTLRPSAFSLLHFNLLPKTLFISSTAFYNTPQRLFSSDYVRMESIIQRFSDSIQNDIQASSNSKGGEQDLSISIGTITSTMREILTTFIDKDQYTQYAPFTDELAYYAVKSFKSGKKPYLSPGQLNDLLQFGTTFDINEKEYWRSVLSAVEKQIENMQSEELLDIILHLKENDLVNSSISKKFVNHMKNTLSNLTANQLSQFVALYTSHAVSQHILRDQNTISFEQKLQYYLNAQISEFDPDEFGLICNAVSMNDQSVSFGSNSLAHHPLDLSNFLEEFISNTARWVDEDKIPLDDMPSVVYAYYLAQDKIDKTKINDLFSKFEDFIFRNSQHIECEEAVIYILTLQAYASQELVELLDRIIGNDVYSIPTNQLIQVFKAFIQTGKARPKIIALLQSQIQKNMAQFNGQELAELANFAALTEQSDINEFFDLMEPYILHKIQSLSSQDLIKLLNAFYSKQLSKRYDVLEQIEGIVHGSVGNMTYDEQTKFLYFYAKNRLGDRTIINSLADGISKHLDGQHQEKDSQNYSLTTDVQALIALNICGKDRVKKLVLEKIQKNANLVNDISREEAFLVDRIISEEPTSELTNQLRETLKQRISQ